MNDETKSLIPLSKASLENCSNLVKFSEISCCERRVEDVVTVTRVKEGEVTTICGNCFEKVKEEDKKAKWERNPTKVGECLLCCQTKVVRENKDLASWVCDDCMKLQEVDFLLFFFFTFSSSFSLLFTLPSSFFLLPSSLFPLPSSLNLFSRDLKNIGATKT